MKQRRIERNTNSPEHVVRIVVHRPSIEHGIPFTPKRRMQLWDYPYDDMNVGDSFLILESETKYVTVTSRIYQYNKIHLHTRFECRSSLDENGEKLTRVWRTE